MRVMLAWSLLPALVFGGCHRASEDFRPVSAPEEEPIFSDRTVAAGIDFTHFNGMTGEHYFNEMMGGGAALFDYDNDGDLDLYLVQGHLLGPGKKMADALFAPAHELPLTDRLYRNDLALDADGELELIFTDVTASSAIDGRGYGMGVAAGDYDNDGWIDLYVTNFRENQLLRNNGDGTFSDRTELAGAGDSRWSVPAVFFDYDRDSRLDLYVGNYVEFSPASARICRSETGAQVYCSPLSYRPEADRLLHNVGEDRNGDVRFEDVSRLIDADRERASTLGVTAADFDANSWPDLYVANDGLPNQLWMNAGPSPEEVVFRNEAVLAGAAVNEKGEPEASMGIDAADFDGDGDEDIVLTHLTRETNTVYLNNGHGLFDEGSIATGLGKASWEYTGFGTAWMDFDNDGWLDLFVANGAVTELESLVRVADPYPLHQTNQLFRNLGEGRFEDVTEIAGEVFRLSEVSRGAAFGDIDNDGDADIVVANNNGPARLLVNEVGHRNAWIGVRVLGGPGPRDQLGARVEIRPADARPLWRRVRTDGSYASARDPRVLAGLGTSPRVRPSASPAVESVRVSWPDGHTSMWKGLPSNRHFTLLRQAEPRPLAAYLPGRS